MKATRLYFIDAVRAFAILMMLQGHFVDTLLDPAYRDTEFAAYRAWSYLRGITAPTFFTISGLVFLYLLLKAKAKGKDEMRLRKGITRALMLIGIGYLLRIPFLSWLNGYFNTYFLVVDVLQCIGFSLLLLMGFYLLCRKNSYILSIVLLGTGCAIFIIEPLYRDMTLNHLPLVMANYLSKANGSVFTLLPWFGYMAFGGFFATLFYRHSQRVYFKPIMVTGFLIIGTLLLAYSSIGLQKLHEISQMNIFRSAANFNYLFLRLGHVLLFFGIFYMLEQFMKQSLVTRIGESTLNIYIVHFIIIYGSFTGIGLKYFYHNSLGPWEAVCGALVFIFIVCFIVFHIGKTNAFIYKYLRKAHLIKKPHLKVEKSQKNV